MCAAGALRGEPASTTTTRRRARPRTRAALRPAAPPPITTTSYVSFAMGSTMPGDGARRNVRCCFRERRLAWADGADDPGRPRRGRPPPTEAASAPRRHADLARRDDGHLEEHAVAARERPAEAEPRAAPAACRGLPGTARRAGRCARRGRPAHPDEAAC